MRSNLQDNHAQQLKLDSVVLGTTESTLTGNITLTQESPLFNAYDANGSDRIVTLPSVSKGRLFIFANIGTANLITVKDSGGTTVVVIRTSELQIVVGTSTSWAAPPGVFGISGANHSSGLVPDPGAVAGALAFLREDGVWVSWGSNPGVDSYNHLTDGSTTTDAAGDDTFKFRSSSGKVTIAVTSNDVTHGDNANFSVSEAAIDHDSLLNYVANKHVDHTGVSISTAANSGLAGGGTIAATRTLSVDLSNLTADTPVLGDSFAFSDLSGSDTNKATLSVLNSILDHNALVNYSADRHFDHTGISMIAGTGLSGGGTIAASRTFNLSIDSLSADTIATADSLAFYDASGNDHNRITFANLNASLDYTSLLNLPSSPYVYISDFGVVADGATDDTVALNACFASVVGTSATVVFDIRGFCKVTSTIIVGQLLGSGVTSFINIECPYGPIISGIKYYGATNGQAVAYGKNKYATCTGLGIYNQVARGTTIGLRLGGDTTGFGNQTIAVEFTNCLVDSFNIGIEAGGNSGAASEISFNQLQLNSNDTGFIPTDFNSLDFNFNMLSMGANGVGIDVGASSGFNVNGGSSSSSTVCDFFIGSNSSQTNINGFRSEIGVIFVYGDTAGGGGQVSITDCYTVSAVSPDYYSVYGNFSKLSIKNSTLDGHVYVNNSPSIVTMIDNFLNRYDTTNLLPLTLYQNSDQVFLSHVFLKNNIAIDTFPHTQMLDFDGGMGTRKDNAAGGAIFAFPEPCITLVPIVNTPSIGTPWLALSHVKQLSEGSVPGAVTHTGITPGKNLRVSGIFATSNSLAFTFKRNLTVDCAGDQSEVNATAGTFLSTDVGKLLTIADAGIAGGLFSGYITHYVNSTRVHCFPAPFTFGNFYPAGVTGKAAVVGEDEPDANYFVAGLCGNVNETFWIDTYATTGFTMHSSNATSTATLRALIVR